MKVSVEDFMDLVSRVSGTYRPTKDYDSFSWWACATCGMADAQAHFVTALYHNCQKGGHQKATRIDVPPELCTATPQTRTATYQSYVAVPDDRLRQRREIRRGQYR